MGGDLTTGSANPTLSPICPARGRGAVGLDIDRYISNDLPQLRERTPGGDNERKRERGENRSTMADHS